jgi:hypothetical protein
VARQIHAPVSIVGAANVGTISSVNDAASSTTILAANANRTGASFFNDSTEICYLALSNTTASATAFTVKMDPGGYFELPVCQSGPYTGVVVGIWASNGSGAMRVTEYT